MEARAERAAVLTGSPALEAGKHNKKGPSLDGPFVLEFNHSFAQRFS